MFTNAYLINVLKHSLLCNNSIYTYLLELQILQLQILFLQRSMHLSHQPISEERQLDHVSKKKTALFNVTVKNIIKYFWTNVKTSKHFWFFFFLLFIFTQSMISHFVLCSHIQSYQFFTFSDFCCCWIIIVKLMFSFCAYRTNIQQHDFFSSSLYFYHHRRTVMSISYKIS